MKSQIVLLISKLDIMKLKILSLAILMSVSGYSCSFSGNGKNVFSDILPNAGNGKITEKSYNYEFDELEIATGLTAEVYKSDKEKIVVNAPEDLMQYVVVKQSGGKVTVKIESHFMKNISTDNIKVKVYARDFDKLTANSSGNIILKDRFSNPNVDVKVSSSGSIKGNLSGDEINVSASSSGDFDGEINAQKSAFQISSSGGIRAKGKVGNLNVQASSSGDVNAENLTAENATLSTSSSADITVGVSNSVTASASSSGDIRIIKKGSLNNVVKNESSSGTVTIR